MLYYVLTIFDLYYNFFFYDVRYILYILICEIDKPNTLCIILKVHIITIIKIK